MNGHQPIDWAITLGLFAVAVVALWLGGWGVAALVFAVGNWRARRRRRVA